MNEDIIKKLKIGYYADLLWRHRWLIVINFCAFIIAGMFFSVTRPSVYKASTTIKVIPKSVPDKYVDSITDEDMGQRITTIELEIKSRTNIEKIIDKYRLFSEPKYKWMFSDDKINAIRKNILLEIRKSRKGIESFTLSYTAEDPEKVKNIVNTLADNFINESVKIIGEEVLGTKKFIEKELEDKAKRLDEVNQEVKKFREEHINELPEQISANLKTLEILQGKQVAKQEDLRDSKYQLSVIEEDIEEIQKEQAELEKKTEEIKKQIEENIKKGIVKTESEEEKKLKELKDLYAIMITKYTEKHPDLKRLKDNILQMESKVVKTEPVEAVSEQDLKIKTEKAVAESEEIKEILKKLDENKKKYEEIQTKHQELITEIKKHEEDIAKILGQIKIYEQRIENTPQVELTLTSLERDFKPIQKSYDALLSKKEDAVIAVRMEMEQKGQKFRMIDEAKKPEKPISPDIKKFFLIFAGAGLGLGIGLTVLLDYIDSSLRRPEDIETLLEVPVLVTIPKIYTRRYRIIRRVKFALYMVAVMFAGFLFASFGILASKGVERTISFVKKIIAFIH